MNAHDDDRLRTLFDDAVSGVEPRGGLDRIQDTLRDGLRRAFTVSDTATVFRVVRPEGSLIVIVAV